MKNRVLVSDTVANGLLILFSILSFFTLRDLIPGEKMTFGVFSTFGSALLTMLLYVLLKKFSIKTKVILTAFICLLVLLVAFQVSQSQSAQSNQVLHTWLSENGKVKLIFAGDSVHIQLDDKTKFRYLSKYKGSDIWLYNQLGSVERHWKIVKVNEDSLLISERSKVVHFRRIDD
jgi:hypothetical protein